ncbi:hypothetical protein WICMUC_003706 [Wickerhamomyces mucosus]|uniref:Cyclin-like domain-containing protein n=1 Tax=Wickerhamomyces mucosus TaxID=1378264 RepID=A0A9P8PJT9_9ASCO|nr:hypothetical protein WICMUC_003706 [Wickerhamomyces mucosus]
MSLGVRINTKQINYPIQLSKNEILSHQSYLKEYKDELSETCLNLNMIHKPDLSLINQQPELHSQLRYPILEYLFKISIKTKVTNGIFLSSIKLFDRYCSKRIVLKDQIQLVILTCLWITAKTLGGCNHVINNTNVPTGGRFLGPNPRARIPRLNELVMLSNHENSYDEGMFIQMERHILNTLNWDLTDSNLEDWVLNVEEFNYLQLNPISQTFQCDVIILKNFLMDLSIFEIQLIELQPYQITLIIFQILKNFYNFKFEFNSNLLIPEHSTKSLTIPQNLFVDKIIELINLNSFIIQYYRSKYGIISTFIEFIQNLQSKIYLTPSNSPIKSSLSNESNDSIYQSNSSFINPSQIKDFNFLPPTPPSSRRGSPIGLNLTQK